MVFVQVPFRNFLALCLLCVGLSASARAIPEFTERVVDEDSLFSAAFRSTLEADLATYEKETGHQFAVLTVDSLYGQPIEDFSVKLAEKWKAGVKGRDDGLILVIAAKDRKMRIEVGRGLEGDLRGLLCRDLVAGLGDQAVTASVLTPSLVGAILMGTP